MKAIIFAGGVGSRLWPLSRKNNPKQFMNIVQDKTMLQLCVDRLHPDFKNEDIYIATGKHYVSDVRKQLSGLPKDNVISEPVMRDVGPAVGLTTAIMQKLDPDEPIALLWGADHLVENKELYRKILVTAGNILRKTPDRIILIGQKPRFASQNLGWIAYGDIQETENEIDFHELKGFKYQPDAETADAYFKDGKHAWNLGYWVTTPRFLWSLYEKFAPELFAKLLVIQEAYGTAQYESVLEEIYPTLEKISFDNAIIEKMDFSKGLVVSAELHWSDIGAWEAMKEAMADTREDNVTEGNVLLKDVEDSLVFNYDKHKLIVGIDLDDFLIVNTHDVLLVTKKSSIPKVKEVVNSLKGTEYEDRT